MNKTKFSIDEKNFEFFVKNNNLEVQEDEFIKSLQEDKESFINKAVEGDLNDEDRGQSVSIQEEIDSFVAIDVLSKGEYSGKLKHTTKYIREKQVEMDADEVIKGENGKEDEIIKARSGTYLDTAFNRKKGVVGQKYGTKSTKEGDDKGKSSKDPNKNLSEFKKLVDGKSTSRLKSALKDLRSYDSPLNKEKIAIIEAELSKKQGDAKSKINFEPRKSKKDPFNIPGAKESERREKEEKKSEFKSKEELGKMSELEVSKYSNNLRMKRANLSGDNKAAVQKQIDLADSFRSFGVKKPSLPEKLSESKSVLTAKKWLENKYGKGFKGSQLSDSEIDSFQDIKEKDKKGFYSYK